MSFDEIQDAFEKRGGPLPKGIALTTMSWEFGGEAGIRTLGRSPFNGFQDRRFRPLSHLSLASEDNPTS